ncbi:MAG: hypothetical protein M1837_002829 [Sclerophora amabilis]|nr:MAG: hypothetical protein M1837_002829 [Sclerophora amabilis]
MGRTAAHWDHHYYTEVGFTSKWHQLPRSRRKPSSKTDESKIFTIVVGAQQRIFSAHQAVRENYPRFRASCGKSLSEAEEKRIVLAEDDPAIFGLLLEYLHTDEYGTSLTQLQSNLKSFYSKKSQRRWNPHLPIAKVKKQLKRWRKVDDSERGGGEKEEGVAVPGAEHGEDEKTRAESEESLRIHDYHESVRLYCMADKFDVQGLKGLILEKLRNLHPIPPHAVYSQTNDRDFQLFLHREQKCDANLRSKGGMGWWVYSRIKAVGEVVWCLFRVIAAICDAVSEGL